VNEIERGVAALEDHLATAGFSGTIRISSGGKVAFEHAGGLANRADDVPNEIDTRFGIASVTKSFTATAICRLVELGAASFDSRVVDLLSHSKRPSTLSEEVTLHHLLTHTSGIADYFDEVNLGAAAYDQIWLEHPSYLFTEPLHFLPLFGDLPPLQPPGGTEASYSNAGFVLLAIIVEELSGRTFFDYVEDELFRAAGMHNSGFFRMDDVRPKVATGYIEDGEGGWKTNHYSIPVIGGGDGGAFCTVRDLGLFLDALQTGTFFGDATWQLMSTPHVAMDEGFMYGYGLLLAGEGRLACFGHGGADPGFSARAYRYPELDMNVTMLGNTIEETDPVIAVFRAALEGGGI
jgi:CubicO group peptidase (beta-lactamase class C family)